MFGGETGGSFECGKGPVSRKDGQNKDAGVNDRIDGRRFPDVLLHRRAFPRPGTRTPELWDGARFFAQK